MGRDAKYSSLPKAAAGIVLAAMFAYIAQLLFSMSYDVFLQKYFYFVGGSRKPGFFHGWKSPILEALFHVVKFGSVLLAAFLLFRTVKVLKGSPVLIFNTERKYSEYLPLNTRFFRELSRPVLIVLLVIMAMQAAVSIYVAATAPFFYDEAWSYMYFSGRGIFAAMCHYPAPNNHVFFNVLGSIVNVFNFDPLATLRIPSLLMSLAATYYFFKTTYRLFAPAVALITTAVFTCSLPVMYFANMGRGYAMLVFFAVLIIYSLVRLCQHPDSRKYMFVFALGSVLGLYTIPSFLYCYVSVALVLGILYLQKGRKLFLRYLLTSVIIVAATWLLYSPIILFNGLGALTNNNGVIVRDMAYIKAHMYEHFLSTWRFLSGYDNATLLSLGALMVYLLLRVFFLQQRTVVLLLVVCFLLPVVFISIQKVIPFERTWSYLIVPVVISLGFLLNDIFSLIAKGFKNGVPKTGPAIMLWLLPITVLMYYTTVNFLEKRPVMHMNDYWAQGYFRLLGDKISKVKVVGFADEDLNFYLAEDIQFEVLRKTGNFNVGLSVLQTDSIPHQDIVILKKNGQKTNFTMDAYTKLEVEEPVWDVYVRKDL